MEYRSYDQYKALLFDLDGTLADSMRVHNEAWVWTLQQYGCQISIEILEEYAGIPNEKTVEIFNERFGWSLVPEEIADFKEKTFFDKLDQVQAIRPVVQIAHDYFDRVSMAVVSGGSRNLVERTLRNLSISHLFPVRVCAGDTSRGKPFPDPFLLAANILKVSPVDCLVFEDGAAGIQGAKAAGMDIIKVNKDFSLYRIR